MTHVIFKDRSVQLEFFDIDGWLGIFHLEIFEGFHDDLRDHDVPVPLVVRRDDEPGSMLAAGAVKDILIGALVVGP